MAMYSSDGPDKSPRPANQGRIVMSRNLLSPQRPTSPQRQDRGNTVTAGGAGRVYTTDELLQAERRKSTALEERLQALERSAHSSALLISNHADQMRAVETRALNAEELAANLQTRLMRLAELVRQQKQQGTASAEIEALLAQQATNAESRLETLQEELKIEKESAMLLQEELLSAKASAAEANQRLLECDQRCRDAEAKLQGAEQRAKLAEERAAQADTLYKTTDQKLVQLVALVKADKERDKKREEEYARERQFDREKITNLEKTIASLQSTAVSMGPGSPSPARGSGPSNRELELQEKLKAADARIQKMTEVMRIADGKVRNAESFEQRAKAAEDARAALEARIKSLEEQLDEAKKGTASALSATQNTDLAALQAKLVNYEGKIRTLVETVKSERTAFQKQLAEAKAHGSQGGVGAAPRDGSLGAPSAAPPPPPPPESTAPPPPPPFGLKKAAKPGGSHVEEPRHEESKPLDSAAKKAAAKVPPIGTPAGNLGSLAEQAMAWRGALKPAPLSPRGLGQPPPPP